ncbi:MAG: alpha/beta hydrolase [Planctomycetaceae bacterium]
MTRSVFRFPVVGILGLFVSSGLLARADEESRVTGTAVKELKGDPPPAPAGFKKPDDVKTALLAGTLKPINIRGPIPDDAEYTEGIEYGEAEGKSLQLDMYRPKNLTKKVPALIFIHGGGWKQGKRSDYRYHCLRFAKRGYVVTSVSYRLVQDEPFPAAIQDVKCAVRWLRANAAKYNVDPDKLAVLGGSAGGHLSMMVGYSSDVPELEGSGGNPGVSSRVQAVVNFYGPTDLTTEYARKHDVVRGFFANKSYEEVPEQYRLASPMTHVTSDDPPTLIFQGTIDELVPVEQADMLAKKLEQVGVPYVYDRLAGWPHSMDLAQNVNDHCCWYIEHFLDRYLPLPQ